MQEDRGDDDHVLAAKREAVAEWRRRSISSLIEESFRCRRSCAGT